MAQSLARRYAVLRLHLDERQRRFLLGGEGAQLGCGGVKAVAEATGIHSDTVGRGVREVEVVGPSGSGGCAPPVAVARSFPGPTPSSRRSFRRWLDAKKKELVGAFKNGGREYQ